MTKIISVHSFRGGTGKSNSSANIAANLAASGKRVAVVDTDVQSPGIHVLFGFGEDMPGKMLNDYLYGGCPIVEAAHDVTSVVANTPLGVKPGGALYLVPASIKAADIAKLPAGKAWIMIEFGADSVDAAVAQANALVTHYAGRSDAPSHWLVVDPAEQEPIWNIRETGASATALALEGDGTDPNVGWEDAAVDPLRLGQYLREFQKLVDDFGYQTSLYGHFGDGCIHARITFDLRSREGIAKWRDFIRGASELVVKYGGSLSGEHGDGQAKLDKADAEHVLQEREQRRQHQDVKVADEVRHGHRNEQFWEGSLVGRVNAALETLFPLRSDK